MIFYVVPYLREYGGIQTFAKSIYENLKTSFQIKLVNYHFYYPSEKIKTILKIFPGLYKFLVKRELKKQKKEEIKKADLIHFWQPLAAIGFEKTNYIVSCHGRELLEGNIEPYKKKALKSVFKNAQKIHANSNYTKRLLLKNFPSVLSKRIKVIYPAVDIEKNSNKKKQERQLVIGTICRLNPRKNIVNIVKALEILKEKFELNFKYLLVGKGIEQETVLKSLKNAAFEYQYKKEISEEEKWEWFFSKLDIFVLPTLSLNEDIEGFGIVYLEANSVGVPVVASNTGGVSEAVKDGVSGLFVDPCKPDEIAEGIYSLAKNKKKYKSSAIQRAKNFSITSSVDKIRKVYQACL